jgi:Ring hydroxylating alpha subunit (catalytic domain)/Rieske [2Fe-2S] domain
MPYFDRTAGLLDRAVFSSESLYRQELSRIFRRVWLFVGPENWARSTGEYFTSWMGETPVIVWRTAASALRIFVNQCSASDGVLTARERGVADNLTCSCHGFCYSSDGIVIDRPHLHATEVLRAEAYKGLIFANFDVNAAGLSAYLGDFVWYLDMLVDRRANGVEAVGGSAFRWLVDANWKVPAEAFAGDAYCDLTLHAATDAVTSYTPPSTSNQGLQVSAGAGAIALLAQAPSYPYPAVVAAYEKSIAAETEARLGAERARGLIPMSGTLFPNLSFDWRTRSLHVWQPRGPAKTEINTYCFADCLAPTAVKDALLKTCQLHYGPAGLRSQDDVGPWSSITERAGSVLAQRTPLNLQMGLGEELKRNLPGRVSDLFSEMNQRSFFAWWEDRLNEDEGPKVSTTMRIAPPR